MRLSENEHIAANNIQIHRLEKLYEENRSLFNELVDFIPLMITISKVRGFSFIFVNDTCQQFINNDKEYLIEKGFGYTSGLVHPDNLAYQMRLLSDFENVKSRHAVLPYFQYFKGEKRTEYQWLLTYKKFLTSELYFSVSHDLSQLGKASLVLREYLGEIALSPHAYMKYQTLTDREKEILQLISAGFTNEQIAESLFLSKNTVRTHRNRIWQKLDIRHFREILKYDLLFTKDPDHVE